MVMQCLPALFTHTMYLTCHCPGSLLFIVRHRTLRSIFAAFDNGSRPLAGPLEDFFRFVTRFLDLILRRLLRSQDALDWIYHEQEQ